MVKTKESERKVRDSKTHYEKGDSKFGEIIGRKHRRKRRQRKPMRKREKTRLRGRERKNEATTKQQQQQ